MFFPNQFAYFVNSALKFSATFMLLACQSASTQTIAQTDSPAELPRANDQTEVSLAPQASSTKKEGPLARTIKRYSAGKSVKIDLVKTSKIKMLDRVEESKGQVYLAGKKKLRLEFNEPAKSVAVLNGNRAWVIEYPAEDTKEPVRISRFKLSNTPGQSQLLITSILSSGNLLENFKIGKQKQSGGKTRYDLTPKKTVDEIKSLSLVIDSKKQEITELKYSDPIDNETVFAFVKTEFGAKVDPSLFEYNPPKNAEVNEF